MEDIRYYSEGKQEFINVDDMNEYHVRNALKKMIQSDNDRLYSDLKIIKAVKALNNALSDVVY